MVTAINLLMNSSGLACNLSIKMFMITQYTLLKQSAIQNKNSQAKSLFGKVKHLGKNTVRLVLYCFKKRILLMK